MRLQLLMETSQPTHEPNTKQRAQTDTPQRPNALHQSSVQGSLQLWQQHASFLTTALSRREWDGDRYSNNHVVHRRGWHTVLLQPYEVLPVARATHNLSQT